MQVSSTRKAPEFRPITITIKVESQEERLALLEYTKRPNQVAAMGASPASTAKDMQIMRNLLLALDHELADPPPEKNV